MLIVRSTVVGPFAENTLLLGDTESGAAILVDPGGEHARVSAMLEPGGFRVTRIVLTHGHVDHVAGCAEAKRTRRAVPDARRGPPGSTSSCSRPRCSASTAQERPDRPLPRGRRGVPGGRARAASSTRPATRAAPAASSSKARVLVAGDTLVAGSVGRTDLPGGDFRDLERSIRERLFPLGDDVRFYPGHGPSALLGDERKTNPFVGEATKRGGFP
jgi:glyoxylase-like metal-dependent hydrolase (beta-lactamase superfamily II)